MLFKSPDRGRSEEARGTRLAFFERHLRERDVPRLPPMRLEIRDRLDHVVEVRDEQEWPLARTDWRQLHLRADGSLSEQPGDAGSVTFDLRRNAASFEHRFSRDTELSGPMTLRLRVSPSSRQHACNYRAFGSTTAARSHERSHLPPPGANHGQRHRPQRGCEQALQLRCR